MGCVLGATNAIFVTLIILDIFVHYNAPQILSTNIAGLQLLADIYKQIRKQSEPWPRGYKAFFILNSAEHGIYPAIKC